MSSHNEPNRHRTRVLFVRFTEAEFSEIAGAEWPRPWEKPGVWARRTLLEQAKKLPRKAAREVRVVASKNRARARLATTPAPRLAKTGRRA